MANLTPEEKKQAIEEFIATHQGKFVSWKCAASQFKLCDPETFDAWIEEIYGFSGKIILETRGVFANHKENKRPLWNELFEELKKIYADKAPAENLQQLEDDNPDVAVYDFIWISGYLQEPEYALEKAMQCGILADPWESDEVFKKQISKYNSKYIASRKPRLSFRSILKGFPRPFHELTKSYTAMEFERFADIFGISAQEYFISKNVLYKHEDAAPAAKKIFDGIVKDCTKNKTTVKDLCYIDLSRSLKINAYRIDDLIDFYLDEAQLKGLSGTDADAYVKQLFINADILAGKKKALPEDKQAEKKDTESKKASHGAVEGKAIDKKFNIYEAIDRLDLTPLFDKAKTAPGVWPKGKKFKVVLNGTEFAVTTYFSKAQEKTEDLYGVRDAAAELKNMKTREEVVEEIREKDPNHRTDAEYYATAAFRNESPRLDDDQLDLRRNFIAAVANLITDQKTMEAIAVAAQKKKNGTLHKGRVQKIALSGIADGACIVYAIVARNKTDTSISITFEDFTSKPGDLDEWNSDFISTYHADLPISEALAKVFSR